MIGQFNFMIVFEDIVRWFINIVSTWAGNMLGKFIAVVPDLSVPSYYVDEFFTYVEPYVIYAKDATMLSSFTIYFIIGTIIFSVGTPLVLFLPKLLLSWWHRLAP